MPRNPFVYGEVVPAAAFVDREDDLERLTADLLQGQKIFLISPRRYGKTSLIHLALRAAARRGALTAEVTVASCSSFVAFLESYASAVLAVERSPGLAREWLQSVVTTVTPEVRRESGGRLDVYFPTARRSAEIGRLAAEVFALPGRIADGRRRRLVVALDEFQAIAAFDGGTIEAALRAAVQHQRRVGYVFAGSEPSLMERMLGPRRPFYKAGPVMRLDRIPADVFARALERHFTRSGLRTEPGLGTAVVELAGNLPYDVQRLAHETWDTVHAEGRRTVGPEDLHRTLRRLLSAQDPFFEATWQRLTLAQRAVLRAAVLEDGYGLLSADVRSRHRLGGASTIQSALAALLREDLLIREGGRYLVTDSLLREWVARKTF